MAQYADPISTESGGWGGVADSTHHGATGDDSDATYIYEGSSGTVQLGLSSVTDPGIHTGHVMRARIAYSSGNGTVTFRMRLYDQSSGYIATSGNLTVTSTSFYEVTYPLTEGEAANITDYTTLEVELYGATTGTRDCRCAKFELEVPSGSTLIGETCEFPYDVRELVGETSEFPYDVRELIGETSEFPYDVFELIGEISEFPYNILELIGETCEFPYDILTGTPIGETCEFPYDIRELIGETSEFPYDIRELIGETSEFPYDIRELIGETSEFPYDIRELIGETSEFPYDIRELIGEICEFPYSILGVTLVGETCEFVYNILAGPNPEVLAGPVLGDVGSDYIKVWAKLNMSGAPLGFEYIEYDQDFPGTIVYSADAEGAKDNQVILKITGLSPNTRYKYRLIGGLHIYDTYDFTTLTADGDNTVIAFISDLHSGFYDDRLANYLSILNKRNVDPGRGFLCVTLGDTFINYFTFESYPAVWADPYGTVVNYISRLVKNVPWIDCWDDWDFLGNNTCAVSVTLPLYGDLDKYDRIAVWEGTRPGPDLIQDNDVGTVWAKMFGNTLVVHLDGRFMKDATTTSRPAASDPYNKVCWHAAMFEWFQHTVLAHKDDLEFLVLINSTAFVDNFDTFKPAAMASRDSVGIFYKGERNQLVKWLDETVKLRNLIVICGDDHYCAGWRRRWVDDVDPSTFMPSDSANYPIPFERKYFFANMTISEFKVSSIGVDDPYSGLGAKFYLDGEELYLAPGDSYVILEPHKQDHQLEISVWNKDGDAVGDVHERVYHEILPAKPPLVDEIEHESVYSQVVNAFPYTVVTTSFEGGLSSPMSYRAPTSYEAHYYKRAHVHTLDYYTFPYENVDWGQDGSQVLELAAIRALSGFVEDPAYAGYYVNVEQPALLSWRFIWSRFENRPWKTPVPRVCITDPNDQLTILTYLSDDVFRMQWIDGIVELTFAGQWKFEIYIPHPEEDGTTEVHIDSMELKLVKPLTEWS